MPDSVEGLVDVFCKLPKADQKDVVYVFNGLIFDDSPENVSASKRALLEILTNSPGHLIPFK